MSRHVCTLLVAAVAVACHAQKPAAPAGEGSPPGTSGAAPLDPALKRPDVIAISAPLPGFQRGINLGNCLDAPSEGAWGTRISEKHFEMAAAAGFDHVRLPVRFSAPDRTETAPPYTVREEFWKRVDWAVDQAAARGLGVIVDVHHYEEIHKQPAAHLERLYAIWRQIASRYASRPPSVAFEILNEPNGELKPALVNEITAKCLAIIREQNPTRIVMANPYFWAASDYLGQLELPQDDPNVVGHFHMYQPILFTHQGAPWMDPWFHTTGVVFPGPPERPLTPVPAAANQGWVTQWFADYSTQPMDVNPGGPRTVFAHFDNAARWVKETGHRVYLGEFAAIDFADAQSRENYVWLVRTEAERRGIGWAYWDDGGKFKAMDTTTGTWNEGLRRALLDGRWAPGATGPSATSEPPPSGGAAPAGSAATASPGTAPSAAAFPPVDLTCTRDEDCATHHRALTDDGRCCTTCEHGIGAATWVQAVEADCSRRSSDGCPMKKCAAAPPVACKAGRCTAVR